MSLRTLIILEFLAILSAVVMTPLVRGPEYLIFFGILWFALFLAKFIFRWPIIVPMMLYLSNGGTRLFVGKAMGMAKFDYLIAMLILGPVLYVMIACSPKGRSGSYFGSGGGGSSGGGCGGGGGGGCGGCGGG